MFLNLIFVSVVSFSISCLIIYLHGKVSWMDHPSGCIGVQKIHVESTPHIGGVAIFLSFSIAFVYLSDQVNFESILLLALAIVFLIGIIEDFNEKVPPIVRLLFIFFAISVTFWLLDVGIFSLGFKWVDELFFDYIIISFLFTLLVFGGVVNSLNIIDGLNGLMSGYAMLVALAIALVAYILNDFVMVNLSLLIVASLFGFFILNFPFGKIFIGDGGSYFIGFLLAADGLILVSRHNELSNWFVLLIFIYPMYELLFSIYRRKIIYKVNASQPDNYHLHSLIYRKIISYDRFKQNKAIYNSMSSTFLWLLSLIGIVPAVIWHDNQTILIIWVFVFMVIYTLIYKYINRDIFMI